MIITFKKGVILVLLIILFAYDNRETNPISSPQRFTFPETVQYLGYPLQTFEILSQDGYYTALYRIQKKNTSIQESGLIPFLLYPGVNCALDVFVANYENKSVAFMLANAGFDVWLLDMRGNRHNQKHKYLDPKLNKSYWDFSWQHMGEYDIPAALNFVYEKVKAKQKKINLLGYSQGASSILVSLIEKQKELKNIVAKTFFLGPCSQMNHVRSLVFKAGIYANIPQTLKNIGVDYYYPDPISLQYYLAKYIGSFLNSIVMGLICDSDTEETHVERFANYLANYPAGTSLNVYHHWIQVINSKKFQKYDYKENNLKIYGSVEPPEFDLGKVTQDVYIFCGQHDLMVGVEDCQWLGKQLKNANTKLQIVNGGHISFMLTKNVSHINYIIQEASKSVEN